MTAKLTVKSAKNIVEQFGHSEILFKKDVHPNVAAYYLAESFLGYHERIQPVIEALRKQIDSCSYPQKTCSVCEFCKKALAQFEKDILGE